MKSFIIAPLIMFLTMSTICNGCQPPHPLFVSTLARYPLVLLLMLSYAARTASAKTISTSGVLAAGIARHPQLSLLCAAGLLLSIPQVRTVAVDQSYRGISTICSSVTRWLFQLFDSLFLGGVHGEMQHANELLIVHTQQLDAIQTGVQAVQNQINAVSGDLQDVQNQLGNVATDVTAVRQRVDESHILIQALREAGQLHGQELGTVHTRCDEMNALLTNCQTQFAQLNDAMAAHDSTSQESVRHIAQTIQNQIVANEGLLNTLRYQLQAWQQSISLQIGGVNDRLASIETNQQQQYTQTMEAFNAGLQQILQQVSRAQSNGGKVSCRMPITNIVAFDKQLITIRH